MDLDAPNLVETHDDIQLAQGVEPVSEMPEKEAYAYGGAIIPGPKLTEDNADDFARRLIAWSFATAPLFQRADGGAVDDDYISNLSLEEKDDLAKSLSLSQKPIPYDKKEIIKVPIEDIEHGEGDMPGSKLRMPGARHLINMYAKMKTPIPPIEAGAPSIDNPRWMISDGSHRFEAAKLKGQTHVDVLPWWDKEDPVSIETMKKFKSSYNKKAAGGSIVERALNIIYKK